MLKNISLNFSVTNILIFLSFAWFLGYFLWFDNYIFYYVYDYKIIILFFIYTFFHWSIFHFLFNAIFLFYFWNLVEKIIWKNKYILFFVFSVLFEGFLIKYIITNGLNVIWISWFCMAVLTYYALYLKEKNNPEYKSAIVFIIINILYGLAPWISLLWHLFWAISGIIFYFLTKDFFRKKMVWAF